MIPQWDAWQAVFEIIAKVSDLPTDVLEHLSKEEAALVLDAARENAPELRGLPAARAQAHAHAENRGSEVHQRTNARDQSRLSLADTSSSRPRPGGSRPTGPGGPEPVRRVDRRRECACSFRRTSSRSIGNRSNERRGATMKRVFLMAVVVCTLSLACTCPDPHCRARSSPRVDRFGWATRRSNSDSTACGCNTSCPRSRDINTCPLTVAVEAHVPGVPSSGDADARPLLGVGEQADSRAVPGDLGEPGETTNSPSGCRFRSCSRRSRNALPPTSDDRHIVALARGGRSRLRVRSHAAGQLDWREVSASQLPAHRRHRPRRLQADERRERCPLRSQRRRRARAGRLDQARLGRCVSGAGSERQRARSTMARSCSGTTRPRVPTQPEITTANGFEALKFVETLGVRPEPARRSHRRPRRRLLTTRALARRNHNGISEPDELQPVAGVRP